jgi:hypothetical protein
MELKINPSHAACKTSNTGTMRCIHQHNENIAVLFHWNHYFNGFHIRRLNGSDFGNYSILSLQFCDYQDAGEYICSVTLNGRFHSVGSMLSIHGMLCSMFINVRENRMGNTVYNKTQEQKRHKTEANKTKQKHITICVGRSQYASKRK